jgi:hypothetical protein
VIVRETIRLNKDLRTKYGKASRLHGQDLHNFMQDNPELEEAVASKHIARLEHHFGQNPSQIGYAWLNGVQGTYKAKKDHADIENHWHVKKIKDAYNSQIKGYARN